MSPQKPAAQAGFSLVELLVAAGITAAVTVIACRVAIDAQVAWQADSARIDLQQRARVAGDTVFRALLEAGGGPTGGRLRGSLLSGMAPVIPRRVGLRGADPPERFRSDVFTLVRAVAEAEHAVLALPAPSGVTAIEITPAPTCALPSCGFGPGTHALLFDGIGNYDIFTVTAAQGMALTLRHHGTGSAVTYPVGSPFVSVESSTFLFDPATRTLRHYDGDASEMPLIDDVVGVEVRYVGDVVPPQRPLPPNGTANCLYASDGAYLAALMPVLPGVGGRTELTGETLTDGPWCGVGESRFDADLLRVRRVRVTLRLQAADPSTRGINLAQFQQRGSARNSAVMVPDVVVSVDVTPRNLVQGW
jgi:hypothetical protein